ncbi:MAG: ferrochelatase [Alphaproteobacteria bacterium]|tara:strand:+ start:703 stop:1710 length:1008 start_codon:yes stop_codon:yes gene_type:complete
MILPEEHPEIPSNKTGVLLVNLGTPDTTNWWDIRKYLKEFLSDKRVIEVNPILWKIILNCIILTFRPSKTAKAYKKIWLEKQNMSPLRYYTIEQAKKLHERLGNQETVIDYAMRYGNPGISSQMKEMKGKGCQKIIVLPLYPQYAAATTATVCDEVYRTLIKMRWQPSVQIIPHYESEPLYIKGLKNSILKKLKEIRWTPDVIVASYHGIPKKYFDKGDPYHCYCHKTTRLLIESLKAKTPIITTFQSRFGPEEWLQPYTDETLEKLPKTGKKKILVICPGFASDCVETLEEIAIEGKESFVKNGGEEFEMIQCLNQSKEHIDLLEHLTKIYLTN